MRLVLLQIALLSPCFTGCGQFFFGFVSNPGGTGLHITGTISTVQRGFYDDRHGLSGDFTAVTFVNSGAATTINFCGDQRSQFPIDHIVHADFNTGIYCSTLIAVTVQS